MLHGNVLKHSPRASARAESLRPGYAALTGLFLGIALLKFGNPALLDSLVAPPASYLEFVLQPWPLVWAYAFIGLLALAGIAVADWHVPRPRWLVILPVCWLAWQFLAALSSSDTRLTGLTLPYFVATTAGFYLGLFALAPAHRMTIFWAALVGCFSAVLVSGFQQRFGGLEAVRQHIYSQPGWENLPADYLKRLAANRIFATLFYPNALAGAVLLFLPAVGTAVWRLATPLSATMRGFLAGSVVLAGLACLYWSKSKAGWLIALVLLGVWVLRFPWRRTLKLALVAAAIFVGLAAFALRFSGYFEQGASSVGARLQYWQAAWSIAAANPVLGSGPGTFAARYRAIKLPDAEMAMLAHNDYLQQASDSGFPGALFFLVFVGGSLVILWRRSKDDPLLFSVWLGLLGWGLQSGVEFALYVPALGWGAFWLLGWLWGTALPAHPDGAPPGNAFDTRPRSS